MIVVRVELWSARTGRRAEIARMKIANVGDGARRDDRRGDYAGETYRGRSGLSLNKAEVQRRGSVRGFARQDRHVWNLVQQMLANMGYGA